jgi:hypothetical protein
MSGWGFETVIFWMRSGRGAQWIRTGRCVIVVNYHMNVRPIIRIWRSWDRASLYISVVKPTRCIILRVYWISLYMFRTVFPSIIRSSRLYIQHQIYVIHGIYPILYVQSWTPDDGRKDRPKRVEWYSVNSIKCAASWFYYRSISRCTVPWTLNSLYGCMTSAPPTGIISDHITNKSSQCQCQKEKKYFYEYTLLSTHQWNTHIDTSQRAVSIFQPLSRPITNYYILLLCQITFYYTINLCSPTIRCQTKWMRSCYSLHRME